jgi:hypothetical protein
MAVKSFIVQGPAQWSRLDSREYDKPKETYCLLTKISVLRPVL